MRFTVITMIILFATNAFAGSIKFLCHDGDLYATTSEKKVVSYASNSHCLEALANSANGFVCYGHNAYSDQVVTYFPSNEECIDAVAKSSPGLICGERDRNVMSSAQNQNLKIRYASASDCQKALRQAEYFSKNH